MGGRRKAVESDADVNGLGRPPATEPDYRDVAVPKTKEELAEVMSKAVARAVSLATTAKDLTEAIKSGTWWYKTLYGTDDGDGWGSGLNGGGQKGPHNGGR